LQGGQAQAWAYTKNPQPFRVEGFTQCAFSAGVRPRVAHQALPMSRPRTMRSEHVSAFWGRRMHPSTHRAQSRLHR